MLDVLESDPRTGHPTMKSLHSEWKPAWSVRAGGPNGFRIVFMIDDDTLTVVVGVIDRRKDVYDQDVQAVRASMFRLMADAAKETGGS